MALSFSSESNAEVTKKMWRNEVSLYVFGMQFIQRLHCFCVDGSSFLSHIVLCFALFDSIISQLWPRRKSFAVSQLYDQNDPRI